MNIIRCPECDGIDLDIFFVEGCISDGSFVESVECLNCYFVFDVKADFTNIKIEAKKTEGDINAGRK